MPQLSLADLTSLISSISQVAIELISEKLLTSAVTVSGMFLIISTFRLGMVLWRRRGSFLSLQLLFFPYVISMGLWVVVSF